MLNIELNSHSTDEKIQADPITVIVPGITVPFNDWIYLLLATYLSLSLHEFGHALAANLYRLMKNYFNFFKNCIFLHLDIKFQLNRLVSIFFYVYH